VLAAIKERMREVGLTLHPEKTRIVYCQDDNRRGQYEEAYSRPGRRILTPGVS